MRWEKAVASLVMCSALAGCGGVSEVATIDLDQTGVEELGAEKLREEIRTLRIEHQANQGVSGAVTRFGPLATMFGALVGAVIAIGQAFRQRKLDRDQREQDSLRRFDEQFTATIANLGSDEEALRVSSAASLATFLKPRYSEFVDEVYEVVVANLKVADHSDLVIRQLVRIFEEAIRIRLSRGDTLDLDLARARLPRVDLSELDLAEADVARANLGRANLTGASLWRARGYGVDLTGARLSSTQDRQTNLQEVRFREAIGPSAHFHGARLVSARLEEANLSGAEFQQAELQAAHFDGATLTGALFHEANVADTYFTGATLDDRALRSLSRTAERSWMKAHFDRDHAEKVARYAGEAPGQD